MHLTPSPPLLQLGSSHQHLQQTLSGMVLGQVAGGQVIARFVQSLRPPWMDYMVNVPVPNMECLSQGT